MSRGIRRKQQKDFEAALKALDCDPVSIMAMIASDRVPCSDCVNTPDTDCKICKGRGFERVPIAVRAQVAAKMLDKLVPDLRSIEHRAGGDEAMRGIEIIFGREPRVVETTGTAPARLQAPQT